VTGSQGKGSKLSVEALCEAVGVSRAGFYRRWHEHAPKVEETALRDRLQQLCLAERFYGYRRITPLLRSDGWCVNHKRVARLMREDNLLCLKGRTFRPATTDARHSWRIWPNLAREMEPTTINQLWVADITYVHLNEAFVYLAVILDAVSRKVVGWSMAEHLRAELALDALAMALERRTVVPDALVHHSDRGVQYACGDYIERLEAARIVPSMSRSGCPYDNAMAESFMKTLKHEEVNGTDYRDLADAKARIGTFIEQVYNRQRLHSALAYRSPEAYENARPWAAAQQPMAEQAVQLSFL